MMSGKLNGGILGLNVSRLNRSVRIELNLGGCRVNLNLELVISGILGFTIISYSATGGPSTLSDPTTDVIAPRLLNAPIQTAGFNGHGGVLAGVLLRGDCCRV